MNKKITFALILSAAMLASCGAPSVGGSSAGSQGSQESQGSVPGTSSIDSGSSEEAAEEYVIKVTVSSGLNLSLSKTKAPAGETITITVVSIESGFTLKALYMNGTALTGNGNVYTFVMPNRSVTITADVEVSGDVVLTGGISAKLEEEVPGSGLYVARNVSVPTATKFHVYAFGKQIGFDDIDYTKCLADIDSPSSRADTNIMIAGGATYDFFYDDNGDSWTVEENNYKYSQRFYVRRNTVTTLPSDTTSLHSLFDGYVQAESSERVQNLKKVTYTESVSDINYVWNNYADGSLATVTSLADPSVSKGVVYKQLKDGVLTSVDNYIERNEYITSPGGDVTYEAHGGRYGVYGTVDSIPYGYSRNEDSEYDGVATTEHDAEMEAHRSQHAQHIVRYSFQDAYYVGFDPDPDLGTEGLGLYDIKVTSEATTDGFDVTIDSYREIDTTSSDTSGSGAANYYLNKVELSFDKAGQIKSVDYAGKKYGTDAYNFSTHTLKDPDTFTYTKNLHAVYEYGDATGNVEFDTTPYLTSSLNAYVIDPDVVDKPKNVMAVTSDTSAATIEAHLVLESNLGDKALDLDNFKVINVANKDLVALRTPKSPFSYYPVEAGTTAVTVGNPTVPSAPKATFNLTIVNTAKIHTAYLMGENGQYSASQGLLTTSTSFSLEAGSVRRFRVLGSPGDYKNLKWEPVSSNESVLKATYYVIDHQSYILFDASFASVEKNTTVTVTLNTSAYDPDYWADHPTTISVTVVPGTSFDYMGDWYHITEWEDTSATIWKAKTVDKNVKVSLQQYDPADENTLSHITVNDKVYTFGFTYHEDTRSVEVTKVTGGHITSLYLDVTVDGYLGVILVDDSSEWTGMDEGTEDQVILGDITYDDEGEVVSYSYDSFAPAKDWDK